MDRDNDSNVVDDSDFDFALKEERLLNYYNDLQNILDDLETRPGWPQSLLSDSDVLVEAVELWQDVSRSFFTSVILTPRGAGTMPESLLEELPPGFEKLTSELTWWCDVGPSSIDPTPLRDFQRLGDNLTKHQMPHWRVILPEEVKDERQKLSNFFNAACDVLSRVLHVAFMKAGKVSPVTFEVRRTKTDKMILDVIDRHGHVESTTGLLNKLAEDDIIVSDGTLKARLAELKANGTLVAWNGNRGYKRPS